MVFEDPSEVSNPHLLVRILHLLPSYVGGRIVHPSQFQKSGVRDYVSAFRHVWRVHPPYMLIWVSFNHRSALILPSLSSRMKLCLSHHSVIRLPFFGPRLTPFFGALSVEL